MGLASTNMRSRTLREASDGPERVRAGTLPRVQMSRSFVHRLRVRYGECDPQGVVFNANFFMYFDVALTELWREAVGPYGDMVAEGVDMVVAEARARFLGPAQFDDELAVEVRIERLGTTSLVTRIGVARDDMAVVEGEMRHVFIDVTSREKTRIPESIRRGLHPYMAPQEAEARS